MTDWYSTTTPEETDRLVRAWEGAPIELGEVCGMILDIARVQVIAYASETEDDPDFTWNDPPSRFVYAQLQQAINLWNAGAVGPDGAYGSESYSFTPRPLDKTIRQIIRPVSGGADVF